MPTFEERKDELWRNGQLYEDPDFPANDSVLYFTDSITSDVIWKRPGELTKNPVFIKEVSYHDIHQGLVGDCFFLSSVASALAVDKGLLNRVIPKGQSFSYKYAGIFRFKFWQYGDWKEIIIDDRLPTKRDGQGYSLIYNRNEGDDRDFWMCLLEKAYAKLYGSYAYINGGADVHALVDLTGGVARQIRTNSEECRGEQFFDYLQKIRATHTLINVGTGVREDKIEELKRKGLAPGHNYAVTKLATVKVGDKTEKLLCILNPWGKTEWNGAWSDRSPEWERLSERDRKQVQLEDKDNGEFWMRLEDVLVQFSNIGFCYIAEPTWLKPESVAGDQKIDWVVTSFKDRWLERVSSGGNNRDSDIYWRNPRYLIDLKNKTDNTLVIISLMEVMKKRAKSNDIAMGADIYQLYQGAEMPRNGRFSYAKQIYYQPFQGREMVHLLDLPPGKFVIIVYNMEMVTCEFLLRFICEGTVPVSSPDDITEPFPGMELEVDNLKDIFVEYVGDSRKRADAYTMQPILRDALRETVDKVTIFPKQDPVTWNELTIRTVRSLMRYARPDHNGFIGLEDARFAYTALKRWMRAFDKFDEDTSRNVRGHEIFNLFHSLNVLVGRRIIESAAEIYGDETRALGFEAFVQCICKMYSIYEYYKNNGLDLSLNTFISEMMRM